MTRILVLYYSSFGHVETMAEAVAEGAVSVGAEADLRCVPETAPPEVVKAGKFATPKYPQAQVDQMPSYNAIIVGTPTNYGNMSSQMSAFWAGTVKLWKAEKLVGKVGAAFCASSSQHGGNEATLLAVHTLMHHHGLLVTGLPYTFRGQLGTDAAQGGTPYGASTLAGEDMSRRPSSVDLDGARFLGRHVTEIAVRLFRD